VEEEEAAVDVVAAVAVDAVEVEARTILVPQVHQRKVSVPLLVAMSSIMDTKE
jgi:plasmid stability protein